MFCLDLEVMGSNEVLLFKLDFNINKITPYIAIKSLLYVM